MAPAGPGSGPVSYETAVDPVPRLSGWTYWVTVDTMNACAAADEPRPPRDWPERGLKRWTAARYGRSGSRWLRMHVVQLDRRASPMLLSSPSRQERWGDRVELAFWSS